MRAELDRLRETLTHVIHRCEDGRSAGQLDEIRVIARDALASSDGEASTRYRCINGHAFGRRARQRGAQLATAICPDCNATAFRYF